MEGDSVTLHTNLIDTKKDDLIVWRFGNEQDRIAQINGGANSCRIYDDVLDGRFRDRLKLNNQTGDLTITNIATQHAGLYSLEIDNREMTTKTFMISVFGNKVKTVLMGDSVILVRNVIMKPGDEKMIWRLQHNNSPVAKMNGNVITYDVHDGRFRDRLQVNDQTGDLTITNITTDDSGLYEVYITVGRHIYTVHRSFSITVNDKSPGLSSGVIAVICVVVVLGAISAVGFIIHRNFSRRTRGS